MGLTAISTITIVTSTSMCLFSFKLYIHSAVSFTNITFDELRKATNYQYLKEIRMVIDEKTRREHLHITKLKEG